MYIILLNDIYVMEPQGIFLQIYLHLQLSTSVNFKEKNNCSFHTENGDSTFFQTVCKYPQDKFPTHSGMKLCSSSQTVLRWRGLCSEGVREGWSRDLIRVVAKLSAPTRPTEGLTKFPRQWVQNTFPGAKATLGVTFSTYVIMHLG